jgi:hypothetical protein
VVTKVTAASDEDGGGKPLTLAQVENEEEGESGTIGDFEIDDSSW